MSFLKRVYNPSLFQGVHRTESYFEGWYYKLIDKKRENVYAIIPGISIGTDIDDAHSFIQIIDGKTGNVAYNRYAFDEFKYNNDDFDVSIGNNRFNKHDVELNITEGDISIVGKLEFTNIVDLPTSLISPGIMGPFSFLNFMECYHGVVNVRHDISGTLQINENNISFDEGEGYIEKDWGNSFPEAWIWLQGNHFSAKNTSFMLSVAKIPWHKSSFIGMVCFLLTDNKVHRFATYNFASIKNLSITDDTMNITIKKGRYTLNVSAKHSVGGVLKAPKNGLMTNEIEESIDAAVHVQLERNGSVIMDDTSTNCGMELSQNAEMLKEDI